MFGASIFPTDAATSVISSLTGAITDNIGVVLALVGFSVGLKLAVRLFNGAIHGKVKA